MINKSTINKIIVYILLSIGSFIMIFPFIWMILSAFKTSQEIIAFPPKLFPSQFNFSNFIKAFQMAPFAKYFFNSVIVMIFSVICTTFTTILGAFAFSRLEFKGKEIVFPCGTEFWGKMPEIKSFLNLIEGGLICYGILVDLYRIVNRMKDPENDRVDVMKL